MKVHLKVYHVPRVLEVDITGMEGKLKQYVVLWKGKQISTNLPYKVQFVVDVQGRGAVKFFAHLKKDGSRPGGRVKPKKMVGKREGVEAAVDLGRSVLTGINGNPHGVLARQLGVPLHKNLQGF
ncbi:hypothetical protein ACFX2J_003368 [Malus domestica]